MHETKTNEKPMPIIYTAKDTAGHVTCNNIFSTDPIAYDVLSAIVRKNVNADKILVHPLGYYSYCSMQRSADMLKTLAEVTNPLLIAHARSKFIVIIADASYGIDVWVWDLEICG